MATPDIQNRNGLPAHIAIIMDGNGRWAEKRGLPRIEGHRAGVKRIHSVVRYLADYGIKYLTLFSFSTENWSRPEEEVKGLLHLLEMSLEEETLLLHKNGVSITHIGRLEPLPKGIQNSIRQAENLTANNTKITCNIAFNYGGRMEILDAVKKMLDDGVPSKNIDDELFSRYLYTTGMPDVDLVIRTSGELRISNFLMWQSAYSELYFTKVLWPDFGKKELNRALKSYLQRKRRFGGL